MKELIKVSINRWVQTQNEGKEFNQLQGNEMAPQVKALKPDDHIARTHGVRRKLSRSCPLIAKCAQWHPCTSSMYKRHMHRHTIIITRGQSDVCLITQINLVDLIQWEKTKQNDKDSMPCKVQNSKVVAVRCTSTYLSQPSDCRCNVDNCLTLQVPCHPHHDGFYPQTVSKNKALLS